MSLGFEQAGFDVVAAVDIDPVHAAAHKFNFPQCAVIPKSITDVTGREIRKAAGIGRKRVDVVFGGAPCQGFSLIGHRALDDPRNTLVREFVRIVRELDASYFVFENVKGLTVGKHRKFLEEVIEAFRTAGYEVQMPWQVLNAAAYGVPQDRERLFLIGAKKKLKSKLPSYPLPSTPTRFVTCREALGDLPDAELYEVLRGTDAVDKVKWGKPSAYARKLRCLDNAAWDYGYKRKWEPGILTSSMRTEHTPISRRRFADTAHGQVEPISRFFKLSPDGVSNTLRAGTDSARGAFTSPRPIHYDKPRCITVREMARLHGFPDWFRFHETKWHGARQIGNAVPPPLARAVANALITAAGIEPSKPRSKVALGDPQLLRMDATQAAAYWGVANPIGRRDRKSGAKKRKQHEIEAARHHAQAA